MKRRQGFTLIELQVGLVLFLFALVVIYEAIAYGLRAHRKGEAARQATSFAREILSRLTAEISTAVALDIFQADPLNGVDRDFESAVLWPDSYAALSLAFPGPFYLRERPTVTLPGNRTGTVDRVHNRLIFSRPGKAADANYSDRDYRQFVYVDYAVIPANAAGEGQHRLIRRLFQVAKLPLSPPQGVNLSGTNRIVQPVFFNLDPVNPFSNPNTTLANLTVAQQTEQQVVLELPRPDDQMSFTVEHSPYLDPRGRPAPPAPGFDPSLFTVSVSVSLTRTDSAPVRFLATRTLTDQTRVKSGN